jgi:glutamine amidotransferase
VRKIPLLGICLGMQLLLEESQEYGITEGLGLIPGRVVPVPGHTLLGGVQKIPHIGWSALQPSNKHIDWKNTLLEDNHQGEAVYFVHGYMADTQNISHRIADCLYGGHKIPAMIGKDHIIGCQFHPEKSGEVGLKILRRFCVD